MHRSPQALESAQGRNLPAVHRPGDADNMNGRELAEKLWNERPGLKVIFTSGYSADIVGKDFKLEPELNYLQKPYQPQNLALTVRRCLDARQGG